MVAMVAPEISPRIINRIKNDGLFDAIFSQGRVKEISETHQWAMAVSIGGNQVAFRKSREGQRLKDCRYTVCMVDGGEIEQDHGLEDIDLNGDLGDLIFNPSENCKIHFF